MKRLTEIKYEQNEKTINGVNDPLTKYVFASVVEQAVIPLPSEMIGVDKILYQKITEDDQFLDLARNLEDSDGSAFAVSSWLVNKCRELFKKELRYFDGDLEKTKDYLEKRDGILGENDAVQKSEAISNFEKALGRDLSGDIVVNCGAGDSEGQFGVHINETLIEILGSKNLSPFASAIGRLEKAMSIADNSRGLRGQQTTNIDMSDDISRVLESEFAMLSDDDCEDKFYEDYLNSSLQSWEEDGDESLSNGNLIILLDISGSMDKQLYFGTKSNGSGLYVSSLDLAKSIIYAILKDRKDKSDTLFQFDYQCRDVQAITNFSASDLKKLLSIHTGGGTDFAPTLEKAVRYCDNRPELGYDILLITDADFDSDDVAAMEHFKKNCKSEARIFSLVIHNRIANVIKKISHKSILLDTYEDMPEQLDKLANLVLDIEEATIELGATHAK